MKKKLLKIILFLLFTGFVLIEFFYTNFHVVIPGMVYRSAQLPHKEYSYYVKKYHIQSVLNLEGSWPGSQWYQTEIKDSRTLGITHYDVYLNAQSLASKNTLLTLAQLLEAAPKPLLIHCWRGADRTGFVSAMAEILLQKDPVPLAKARAQISLLYGVVSPSSIGHLEFNAYNHWLLSHHLTHSKEHFMLWLHS